VLTAHAVDGRRGSWFDPVQLDALTRTARHPAERRPDLQMASAITLIEQGRYWYRGRAPEALAATHRFEQVAEFLWTGHLPSAVPAWPVDARAATAARRAHAALPGTALVPERLRVVVAVLGALDALRFDLRPAGVTATARRLMATTVAVMAPGHAGTLAERVGAWLGPRRLTARATRAIDTALIVMADHELAASTLAVRVAASFRADPYAAVSAGLGAMAGTWHGAASRRVEEVLAQVARGQPAERVVGRLLLEAPAVPGFGHPLYPGGDPRVEVLLALARSFQPTAADAVLAIARAQGLPPPNVDFALGVLARALRLPAGAGEAIFTVGRLAGWTAHALEEYANPTAFRQRAVYTGPRPE
jgi:citrate synthase